MCYVISFQSAEMYNNIVIAYSPNIKYLGIAVTSNLKQHAHTAILHKILNKAYFMIKSLQEVISHHSEFCTMDIFSLV